MSKSLVTVGEYALLEKAVKGGGMTEEQWHSMTTKERRKGGFVRRWKNEVNIGRVAKETQFFREKGDK